jgi:hypothetical protein
MLAQPLLHKARPLYQFHPPGGDIDRKQSSAQILDPRLVPNAAGPGTDGYQSGPSVSTPEGGFQQLRTAHHLEEALLMAIRLWRWRGLEIWSG